MPDKTWKAFERRVAKFFKGRRNPLSGGNAGHTRADVIHDSLYIECKCREKFAVISLWNETKELATLEHKTPVVCLHENGRKGFFVLVHSDDLTKLTPYIGAPNESE
jgi:hypothetical protein